jgi:hypothetical protein
MKKHKTLTIKVQNRDQSLPMAFEDIDNCYVKEGFYCMVNRHKNEVQKYPIFRIFRVIEEFIPTGENKEWKEKGE